MAQSLQFEETARWVSAVSAQFDGGCPNGLSLQKVYIVAKEFTRRVLTEERSFSFEHGLADVGFFFFLFCLLPSHD